MTKVTGRRHRGTLLVGLAAVLATAACTTAPEPPPTIRVDRGLVATTVAASGSLVAITEQNLGFPEGGKLAEVLVKVGDRVEPGQILARLDDFELEQALVQSRAQLSQQQAALDKIRNGNSVDAAKASLEQAEEILEATEEQVEATNNSNKSATQRARVQLDFDKSVLERAERKLREDREDCKSDDNDAEPTQAPTPAPTTPPAPAGGNATGQDSGATGATGSGGSGGGTGLTGGAAANAACDRIEADKAAVQDAKRVVLSSETTLDAAEEREKVDSAAGRLSIANARQSVVSARNELDTAGTDRPADINVQAAQVRDAQAAVALAQRNVDDAALRAPVAGVVSAINGAVGEFVGAASGATAQAPGSTAGLPDVSAASGATGTGGGGAAPSPGGGALIVLNDVESFQLVVPFEESDATRVVPGQQVEVSFDAVPDLTRPGTVLAVAPTGDEVSGIVNYYATVVLTESDPRLRDGQTAEAAVAVESVDNVLRVPSAAVRTEAGRSTVTSPAGDGATIPTPFEAGLVGDQFIEVRSGLSEGQEIVLPQAQVTPGAAGPGGGDGGGG